MALAYTAPFSLITSHCCCRHLSRHHQHEVSTFLSYRFARTHHGTAVAFSLTALLHLLCSSSYYTVAGMVRFRLSRHHLLIVTGFLLHGYNNLAYRFLDEFLPHYATSSQQQLPDMAVGVMMAAFSCAIFLTSPWFGNLSSRVGYKKLILAGLIVESLSLFLLTTSSLTQRYRLVLLITALRLVEGVGSAATQTGCYALLAAESGEESEGAGSGMGGMEMFGGVGNMMGPVVGAWLYEAYGYVWPFVCVGLMGVVSLACTAWVLPQKQQLIDEVDLEFIARNTLPVVPQHKSDEYSTADAAADQEEAEDDTPTGDADDASPDLIVSASSRAEVSTSVRAFVGDGVLPSPASSSVVATPSASQSRVGLFTILCVPSVLYTAIISITALACMSFLAATLTIAFHQQHNMEDVEISLCFALSSFVQLIFCPVAGWMSERFATKLPMFIGLSLLSVALLLLGPSPLTLMEPNVAVQLVALCMLGAGVSLAIIPTFPDQLKSSAHLGTASQATVAGLSAASFSLGEVVGPVIGSMLVEVASFEWACTALSFACMAVLGCGWFLIAIRVLAFDAAASKAEAVNQRETGEVEEGGRHYNTPVQGNGHSHNGGRRSKRSGQMKKMVELITRRVDEGRHKRAGYEKADAQAADSSPDNSPTTSPTDHAAHPQYSPNPSYILPPSIEEVEASRLDGRTIAADEPAEEEKVEDERHAGSEQGVSGSQVRMLDLGGMDEAEDGDDVRLDEIDVVGEAGDGLDYDWEGYPDDSGPQRTQTHVRCKANENEDEDGGI